MQLQWDLCIMDTWGPTIIKCPEYQSVPIFQINLYDKAPFETITTCVDYAGSTVCTYMLIA